MKKHVILGALLFASVTLIGQKNPPENWYLKDYNKDKVYGVSSETGYQKLTGKTSKTVIVAVIDSGVDIEHEDLKGKIWINEKEIPNNGIDDDGNGYIDDVYGWSFLGGKTEDINHEALEVARIYHKLKVEYANKDTTNLSGEAARNFEYFKKVRAAYTEEQMQAFQQYKIIGLLLAFIDGIKKDNGGEFNAKLVKKYKPQDQRETIIKSIVLNSLKSSTPEELEHRYQEGEETYKNLYEYNKMNVDSLRRIIVGDNPDDPKEQYYGCNRVKGPDAFHGTHVAGIIAATRGNNLGIEGIAVDVKIMAIRAVPNGDERDKDVANAIRYAVDNGASIINMSFGKYYTNHKSVVDEAIEYAKSKDVLLVHAAGNDSKNKDLEDSYPTRILDNGTVASNWLEVGASAYKAGPNLIGSFSNYGATTVDLFAPGVDIYSTVPDLNQYKNASGTSMASPAAAGVAAIIRGYFPELKAEEVKAVLMKTVTPYSKSVIIPGGDKKTTTTLDKLCISGGFINTESAINYLMSGK
jgi:subtilisin family serine protease